MILIKNAKPFDLLIDNGKIRKTGKVAEKPETVIDGIMQLQDKIARQRHPIPFHGFNPLEVRFLHERASA